MSTLSSSSAAGSDNANTKPKRPLSGYNLFYRYKRIKVLEATSKIHPKVSDEEQEAAIRAVITAVTGLENSAPDSPMWTLSRPTIDDIRANNIRSTMEGKLFPNENARQRLHRKVHGMGFVEMGKTMRDMWAKIDETTKDVFCELADIGRVRYRKLLAEYQREQRAIESSGKDATSGAGEGPPAAKRAKVAPSKAAAPTPKAGSSAAATKAAVVPRAPARLQATPRTAAKTSLLNFVSPGPLPMWARAHFGNPTIISNSSPVNNMTFCRSDSFEPLMVARKDSTANPKNDQSRYGRRVSENSLGPILNGGGAPNTLDTSVSSGAAQRIADEFHEFQQFLLRNALRNGATPRSIDGLLPSYGGMNSLLPPPPLYQRALQQQQQRAFSQSGSFPSTVSSLCQSPSPYKYDDDTIPKEQDVSARDFMEFIGQVDEAIDHNVRITATTTSETKNTKKEEDCCEGSSQFIFGKSVHDVGCSRNLAVPESAMYEPNNSRARTA